MSKQMVKHGGATVRASAAFSEEQKQIVRDSLANGASEQEFTILWEMAKARNLDPLKREVFFVKRWDSQRQREIWSIQVSIDGLRLQAARTGDYDGQDDTEFEYDKNGGLTLARTRVYRKGITRPFIGTAYWKEFAQTNKEGKLTSMWANKPHVMLGKCSESLALRKAFPDETAGLYTTEEMPEPVARVEVGPIRKPEFAPSPAQAAALSADGPMLAGGAVPADTLEAEVVTDSAGPSPEEIKYLEFDARITAAEWKKEMEQIRVEMKEYYAGIEKPIPESLVAAWKKKRPEVP